MFKDLKRYLLAPVEAVNFIVNSECAGKTNVTIRLLRPTNW